MKVRSRLSNSQRFRKPAKGGWRRSHGSRAASRGRAPTRKLLYLRKATGGGFNQFRASRSPRFSKVRRGTLPHITDGNTRPCLLDRVTARQKRPTLCLH